MKRIALLLVTIAIAARIVAVWAQTSTRADVKPAPQSAKQVRGATPYAEIENEVPPKLILDPPLRALLAHTPSIVWIQWRVENVQLRTAAHCAASI